MRHARIHGVHDADRTIGALHWALPRSRDRLGGRDLSRDNLGRPRGRHRPPLHYISGTRLWQPPSAMHTGSAWATRCICNSRRGRSNPIRRSCASTNSFQRAAHAVDTRPRCWLGVFCFRQVNTNPWVSLLPHQGQSAAKRGARTTSLVRLTGFQLIAAVVNDPRARHPRWPGLGIGNLDAGTAVPRAF